jgi:hypothetical protein
MRIRTDSLAAPPEPPAPAVEPVELAPTLVVALLVTDVAVIAGSESSAQAVNARATPNASIRARSEKSEQEDGKTGRKIKASLPVFQSSCE